VEALLVHEPADEQHELLVRRGELRAQARQVLDGLEVGRVDAVRDRGHACRRHAEHVDDLPAHVGRAGDHVVGRPHHPSLDAVDVRLRVLVDPALVAAVLGRVDGHQPRDAEPLRQPARRVSDEPVV
jgi:hypothetical protein